MGNLFKSKSTAVQDPTAVAAFNLAKPFYQQGLGNLGNLASFVEQNPAYAGQRVADLNPFQTNAANTLGNFAGNTAGMAQNFLDVGQGNLAAGAGVGGNAQDIFSRASMDPTQMILDQANMYANNPYVSGVIDAANRDVMRGLTEQQLPSLARGFAGSGNTNSSRAGVESAIAQRGAADRMADTASNIRSQFFGQGLGMAQNQFNQNLSNMLNANQNLLQAGQFGAGLMGAGQDFANNAFTQGQAAGGMFQQQDQRGLDASKAFFDESLANRLGVNQGLVSSAAQTKTQGTAGVSTQPSIASQIGGAMMAAGSLGFKPFSDIRMKENIAKVGALPSGLGLYSYEYKPEFKDIAGHGQFVGVMAQEAAELFPDSVELQDNGYFRVDYSKIH